MYMKAIRIDETEDETLRILNAVLSDRRTWIDIKPSKVAVQLGVSEAVVRYNVKKLFKQGLLCVKGSGYVPTDKVLFRGDSPKRR